MDRPVEAKKEMRRSQLAKETLEMETMISATGLAKEARLRATRSSLIEQSMMASSEERRESSNNSRAWGQGSMKIRLGQ
jgi:hypothetical protein